MNSRLLTTSSDDPNDEPVLTPNHFLIGQMGGDFIPESVDRTFNPRKHWRRVQELTQHDCVGMLDERIPTPHRLLSEVVLPYEKPKNW